MSFYNFGVEIEAIVEPHNKKRPVPKLLPKFPNIFLKIWYVPLEAVSPKLPTNKQWEDEIDAFWSAMSAVFHMPRRSSRCGSHVHVSPERGYFSLKELKAIAFAVVWYDHEVQQVLHRCRRDKDYCRRNLTYSTQLNGISIETIAKLINNVSTMEGLVNIIQGSSKFDRRVLWNFQNVVSMSWDKTQPTGTVEFRGGRCLRGPVRTKRWIAFAVAFVVLAIQEFSSPLHSSHDRTNIDQFWERIRAAAAQQTMNQYLPTRYTTMNDSSLPDIIDEEDEGDLGNDDPYDPPNFSFVSQSANNSLVNTPSGSDVEDNY